MVIFTEYGDTKRYLKQKLNAAIRETDLADERIMDFHGGMSDEQSDCDLITSARARQLF